MLKNASEGNLNTKNIFFLKILNFVQSFVQCKVSLADGTLKGFFESLLSVLYSNHVAFFPLTLSLTLILHIMRSSYSYP
jgi:hypothetical protein